MENFGRSKSIREGRMQLEGYYGGDNGATAAAAAPTSMHELRSYSTSYAQPPPPPAMDLDKEVRMKKSKTRVASTTKSWSFNDPELQRKKRVVNYKAYAVEGKMKGSLRRSFRWIKGACNQVIHGWW